MVGLVDEGSGIPGIPREAPDLHHFWEGLLRAVKSEPRDLGPLRGASGLKHEIIAAGVDDARKRLVVVSGEADAAAAAMAQADIQAAAEEVQVVVARPLIVDVSALGRALDRKIGRAALMSTDFEGMAAATQELGQDEINVFTAEVLAPLGKQIFNARAVGSIDLMQGLIQFLRQIAEADWTTKPGMLVDLSNLLGRSPTVADSEVGVCPIPLYDFTEDELELFNSGSDADAIEAALRKHDLLQYFFPPPDQTALGLVDRGQRTNVSQIVRTAPGVGHPLGSAELIPEGTSLTDLIDELGGRGYIAEGEVGYELTSEGRRARARVAFKPREGLISKLISRFAFKVNVKSLFKLD